ncbi:MAG: ABC transporter substrate-binding protein [Gammaproteobacteria bacterium]|nr:ABC transporter substrate-binding protein [Gammaproteobacteria bacterium]
MTKSIVTDFYKAMLPIHLNICPNTRHLHTLSLAKFALFLFYLIPVAATGNETEVVVLKLKWLHQFQFAGYYAAQEKGFYREAGLNVKFKIHGLDLKSPIDTVLSGEANYGVTDIGVVKERLAGKPVVVLANIFQKSPLVFIALKNSGIQGVHDLVGKQVMYTPGLESELLAMLQVEGIPAGEVDLRHSSFKLKDLIDGHTDAYSAYATNEPYTLRKQGIPYQLITPRDYGIHFYGDSLFTSQSEIREHPERTRAFRLASLKGWKYALDHPDEIIKLIRKKYAPKKSVPHLEFEAKAVHEMIMPDLVSIGHVNPGRWRVIAERLVSIGLSEPNYDLLNGFIFTPSPEQLDLKPLYRIIAAETLLALLFLALTLLIGRLNIRLKASEQHIQERNLTLEILNSKLNQAQEITHIGSYEWDLKTGHVTWTKELYRIAGFAPDSFEPSYEKYLACIHPDDRDTFIAQIEKALQIKKPYSEEYRIIHPNGEIFYIHQQGELRLDARGEISSLFGAIQDITERKQAENEKVNLQQALQESQKMEALGKLTGGIAHEYNNMLAIMMGFAELLKSALAEQPKLANYADEIQHAGERGSKLTQKLLVFSRQNTDEASSVNLNTLLKMRHHMLEKSLTVRIKLILKLQENLWQVWLDEGCMEDVILNMSINAMHAIKENGQLTIQTQNRKIDKTHAQSSGMTPGDYVLISFTDTGCGIDETIKGKIFEPFFTTKGKDGSGLGLSIVYGFVQNSGGTVKVDSKQNKGSRFTLYFPRYSGNKLQSQVDKNKQAEITFTGNKTILLVDDEHVLLSLNSEILISHDFNVICAESAREALVALEHNNIDILISDIIMPEMDGYQLAALVKEKYPLVKIQLLSGFSNDRNINMADKSLQKNILFKPFSSQALLDRIYKLIEVNEASP